MNEQLLTEPELTPIIEAFFETQKAYNRALENCSWSMSLKSAYHFTLDSAENIGSNIEKLANRADEITEALVMCVRFADFVSAGIDRLAADYQREMFRYNEQQHEIATRPEREWRLAYNARLAEIDKQIKGAKSRLTRIWSKFRKNELDWNKAAVIAKAIELEIEALRERREVAAAERFEKASA